MVVEIDDLREIEDRLIRGGIEVRDAVGARSVHQKGDDEVDQRKNDAGKELPIFSYPIHTSNYPFFFFCLGGLRGKRGVKNSFFTTMRIVRSVARFLFDTFS